MNTLGRKQVETPSAHRKGVHPGLHIVWTGLLCFLFCVSNLPGKQIDRLLVAVNGTVITEGDLHIARSLNPLVFSGENIDPVSRREEIDGLINLELIRQELENFSVDSEDAGDLDERVKQLQDRLADKEDLVRLLERLGLRESELNSYLKFQISILDFVEYRFSPFAGVSESEIEEYYNDTYVPQLRESGIEAPPPDRVSSRIEEILKAEKINEALDQWLLDARENAQIEYFGEDDPASAESEHSRERFQSGVTE